MRAHEAGALHADINARGPAWLREPGDANALVPHLWPGTAEEARRGPSRRRRRPPRPRGGARHPGVRAGRGRLPGPGARLPRRIRRLRRLLRRQGLPVHHGRPLGGRGGAGPRRLLRRRAHRGAAGGHRPGADRLPRQQQVVAELRRRARGRRRPDRRRLLRRDRPARRGWPRSSAPGPRSWCGSPPASRRTPTSTSPPPTRTRSSASRSTPATPSRRSGGSTSAPGLELLGLHSHIGSQIFDTSGLRGRGPTRARAARAGPRRAGRRDARAGPRRRLRHRLHDPGRPGRPAGPRRRADGDRRARVPRARSCRCRGCRSSRDGRSSGRPCARSTRSARSSRSSSTAVRCGPTSRSTAA